MTPTKLLGEIRRRGISISVHDGKLRLTPASAVDESLRDALQRAKPDLLKLLQQGPALAPDGGPLEQCRWCGCPTWWQSAGGVWRCEHCEPRTEAVRRFFVVAGGEWGQH